MRFGVVVFPGSNCDAIVTILDRVCKNLLILCTRGKLDK